MGLGVSDTTVCRRQMLADLEKVGKDTITLPLNALEFTLSKFAITATPGEAYSNQIALSQAVSLKRIANELGKLVKVMVAR